MNFRMRHVTANSPSKGPGVLDSAIRIADGEPLPGVMGVAQSIANIWTDRRDGPTWLRHTRSALLTAGVVRAYVNGRDGRIAAGDNPIEAEIDKRFRPSQTLDTMDEAVWQYLMKARAPFKDYSVGDDVFREFACGAVFVFYAKGHLTNVSECAFFPGQLWVEIGRDGDVNKAVSDAIWRDATHGLNFQCHNGDGDGDEFSFTPLSKPGDFVDAPSQENTASVRMMAHRCRLFATAKMPRSVLLHGAPGTGKSTLARQLAISIGDGRVLRLDPVAISKCSNNKLKGIVELLAPSVLLLDDMDRARGADELLTYMEGRNANIVVGTVNAIDAIDPALLRPGRFDEVLEVTEPSQEWLASIVNFYASKHRVELPDGVSDMMAGFSPADVQEVVKVVSIVGVEVLYAELERVRKQRGLYSGNATSEFIARRSGDKPRLQ